MPTIELHMTEDDLAAAARLHKDRKRGHHTWIEVILILLFAWFFLDLLGASELLLTLIAAVGAVMGLVFYFVFCLRHSRPRVGGIAEPQIIAWTEAGMTVTDRVGRSSLRWTDLKYWTEGGGTMLLYRSYRVFHIVPARAFVDTSELQQIREYLANAGVPRIGAKRPGFDGRRAKAVF